MRMGVAVERITSHGQLALPVTFEYNDIVAETDPIFWAVTTGKDAAVLSRHRDVITERLDRPVCGVTVPDAELTAAVPRAVFDAVDGLAPDTDVVFVLTTELARSGGVLVVPRAAVDDFDAGFVSAEAR